jgi:hypothetical protein
LVYFPVNHFNSSASRVSCVMCVYKHMFQPRQIGPLAQGQSQGLKPSTAGYTPASHGQPCPTCHVHRPSPLRTSWRLILSVSAQAGTHHLRGWTRGPPPHVGAGPPCPWWLCGKRGPAHGAPWLITSKLATEDAVIVAGPWFPKKGTPPARCQTQ